MGLGLGFRCSGFRHDTSRILGLSNWGIAGHASTRGVFLVFCLKRL